MIQATLSKSHFHDEARNMGADTQRHRVFIGFSPRPGDLCVDERHVWPNSSVPVDGFLFLA